MNVKLLGVILCVCALLALMSCAKKTTETPSTVPSEQKTPSEQPVNPDTDISDIEAIDTSDVDSDMGDLESDLDNW